MEALLSSVCSNYKDLFVPEILLDSLALAGFLFISIFPFLNCCGCFDCCNDEWRLVKKLQNIRDKTINQVFDKILQIQHEGKNSFVQVFNYEAPRSYTNLLFLTFVLLITSAVMQFMDDFLIAESDCTTKGYICCFDADTIATPRLDCSNTIYLEEHNITNVVCYRFVFRLGTATGSAIGVVATTAASLLAITWGLLYTSKGTRSISSGNRCTCTCQAVLTVLLQVFAAGLVLLVTAFLCYNKVVSYPDSWIGIAIKVSEVYPTGSIIAIYIILFPWYEFEKIQKPNSERNNESNSERNNESNSERNNESNSERNNESNSERNNESNSERNNESNSERNNEPNDGHNNELNDGHNIDNIALVTLP